MAAEDGGALLRARPGTILAHASAILRPFGRHLGPDPASADVATIGGVIANNAGVLRCTSARGHDVGPVDIIRLALHTRLDAAYQRLDLGTAELIVDVKASDNPRLAWTDERDKSFVNGGHSGVGEEEGPHSLFISRPEWLGGGTTNIAIPVSRGGSS